MKLFILACLLFPAKAYAQGGGSTYAFDVGVSSALAEPVYISTWTGVDVTSAVPDGALLGAHSVEVYNPSGNTQTIACGFDSGVSTQTANAKQGRDVAPGTGMVWQVLIAKIKIFCMSRASTTQPSVVVTQIR